MQITRGKIATALKVVVYGPEGIGKSTFASHFPGAVFIDTEGSTRNMDVARTPEPLSYTQMMSQIEYFVKHPGEAQTIIIDTMDWAERLCKGEICSSNGYKSIEDTGYGKGYTMLAEQIGHMLDALSAVAKMGINVVITAHAMMRKFEQPDEMGSYDRWELKLEKKVAPLVKEWSDMLLFANYKTIVVNVDDKGAAKGKNKVQGGRRVMYTSHHPCWDAKNRFGLPEELPFEYSQIAHLIPSGAPAAAIPAAVVQEAVKETPHADPIGEPGMQGEHGVTNAMTEDVPFPSLLAMMKESLVTCDELRTAVYNAGYYPLDTPIATYDPEFVHGELIPNWAACLQMIEEIRGTDPF